MTSLRIALAALPPLGLLLASYAACSGKSEGDTDGAADAATEDAPDAGPDTAGDVGGEADAEPPWGTLGPWDPVWHETAPFVWPEVSHDDLPSCGPGCTMLTAYRPHPFIPFSVEGKRVAYTTATMNDTNTFALFVDLKTVTEYLFDDGSAEPILNAEKQCDAGIPSLSGDFVLYEIICKSHSRIVLRSLVTGEKKTVALFGPISDGAPGRTGLTPTHAYWYFGNQKGWNSVSSFDLETGETKTTTAGVSTCRTFWVRAGPKGDVVLCTNEDVERIVLVDIANDQASLLAVRRPSGYISQMKTANLSDVKNDLSRLVDRARRGERIRILVRGVPAADIVPVESAGDLRELEYQGVVRRGSVGWPKELDEPGPRVAHDAAVTALIRDRRAGR